LMGKIDRSSGSRDGRDQKQGQAGEGEMHGKRNAGATEDEEGWPL
jgi:hypothetical protein